MMNSSLTTTTTTTTTNSDKQNSGSGVVGRYRLIQPIGKGSCGSAHLALDSVLDQLVVVKQISLLTSATETNKLDDTNFTALKQISLVETNKLDELKNSDLANMAFNAVITPKLKAALNEIQLLEAIAHPNIIHYVDSFIERKKNSVMARTTDGASGGPTSSSNRQSSNTRTVSIEHSVSIVMEFAENGDLFQLIEKRRAGDDVDVDVEQRSGLDVADELRLNGREQQQTNSRSGSGGPGGGLSGLQTDSNTSGSRSGNRRTPRYFSCPNAWLVFIQLLMALRYVHSRRILHRDIKTRNIFLTYDGLVKLGDFGIAKQLTDDMAKTIVGSPYFMAPELHQHLPYGEKSDVWSLGCVLFEICTLQHAFAGDSLESIFAEIQKYNSQKPTVLQSWVKRFKFNPSDTPLGRMTANIGAITPLVPLTGPREISPVSSSACSTVASPEGPKAGGGGGSSSSSSTSSSLSSSGGKFDPQSIFKVCTALLAFNEADRPSSIQILHLPEVLTAFHNTLELYPAESFPQFLHLHEYFRTRLASKYKAILTSSPTVRRTKQKPGPSTTATSVPETSLTSSVGEGGTGSGAKKSGSAQSETAAESASASPPTSPLSNESATCWDPFNATKLLEAAVQPMKVTKRKTAVVISKTVRTTRRRSLKDDESDETQEKQPAPQTSIHVSPIVSGDVDEERYRSAKLQRSNQREQLIAVHVWILSSLAKLRQPELPLPDWDNNVEEAWSGQDELGSQKRRNLPLNNNGGMNLSSLRATGSKTDLDLQPKVIRSNRNPTSLTSAGGSLSPRGDRESLGDGTSSLMTSRVTPRPDALMSLALSKSKLSNTTGGGIIMNSNAALIVPSGGPSSQTPGGLSSLMGAAMDNFNPLTSSQSTADTSRLSLKSQQLQYDNRLHSKSRFESKPMGTRDFMNTPSANADSSLPLTFSDDFASLRTRELHPSDFSDKVVEYSSTLGESGCSVPPLSMEYNINDDALTSGSEKSYQYSRLATVGNSLMADGNDFQTKQSSNTPRSITNRVKQQVQWGQSIGSRHANSNDLSHTSADQLTTVASADLTPTRSKGARSATPTGASKMADNSIHIPLRQKKMVQIPATENTVQKSDRLVRTNNPRRPKGISMEKNERTTTPTNSESGRNRATLPAAEGTKSNRTRPAPEDEGIRDSMKGERNWSKLVDRSWRPISSSESPPPPSIPSTTPLVARSSLLSAPQAGVILREDLSSRMARGSVASAEPDCSREENEKVKKLRKHRAELFERRIDSLRQECTKQIGSSTLQEVTKVLCEALMNDFPDGTPIPFDSVESELASKTVGLSATVSFLKNEVSLTTDQINLVMKLIGMERNR